MTSKKILRKSMDTSLAHIYLSPSKLVSTTSSFVASLSKLFFKETPYENEAEYRKAIQECLLDKRYRSQQHEDRNSIGIPDLSFSGRMSDGWIEVKYLPTGWDQTSIPTNFTSQQREFLIENGKRGAGHCYLWIGWWDGRRNDYQIIPWHKL